MLTKPANSYKDQVKMGSNSQPPALCTGNLMLPDTAVYHQAGKGWQLPPVQVGKQLNLKVATEKDNSWAYLDPVIVVHQGCNQNWGGSAHIWASNTVLQTHPAFVFYLPCMSYMQARVNWTFCTENGIAWSWQCFVRNKVSVASWLCTLWIKLTLYIPKPPPWTGQGWLHT